MYVVMVAAECALAAKAGGLADVVFGLSHELELRGNRVEIVLPKYAGLRHGDIWDLHVAYRDLWVPWYEGAIRCTVYSGDVHGRRCFFIDPHSADNFFGRDHLYGYADDVARFSFFSKAVLEFLCKSGKRPDVIHCHDWQTGLVPVLLYELYHDAMPHQRVCYTVHNFRHQGLGGSEVLWATGLGRPEHFLSSERLGDDHRYRTVNLLKGGIVYSNFVTTVSPNHAGEVRYGDASFGLGHTLHVHQGKFGGVLNGVDYDLWNPETDPFIPAHYSVANVEPKYEDKERLRERFWLRKTWSPVVAYVGRLDWQKGMHLVHHALFHSMENGAQFVLLSDGSQRSDTSAHFWHLKHDLNDNPDCHIELGYSEELAHLVYAGADFLVAPSMFEPCGLVPMIGLRYGTIPIVRGVGGMVDTVFDRDYSDRPPHERNGYVFHQSDNAALESALGRAISLWFDYPGEFRLLMGNAMAADHSWARAGQDYLHIYDLIRHR